MNYYAITPFVEAMCNRLYETHQQRNLSYDKIAEYMFCDKKTIIRIEHGRQSPSLHQLLTLTKVYEVDIIWIMGGNELLRIDYQSPVPIMPLGMRNYPVTIPKRLALIRNLKGYKQSDVANLIGCKKCTISHIELARQDVSIETIVNLCLLYKVNIRWVIYGTEEEIHE